MAKGLIHLGIEKQIQRLIESPKLKDLDNNQLEKIAKAVYVDNLKKEFEHEVKKLKINQEELIYEWLDLYASEETKRVYKKNIHDFLNWLSRRKKNSLLDVNSKAADSYISYTNNQKISSNSKRLRISTCSSLFRQLLRWQVVNINPFRDSRSVPKREIERKSVSDIPGNEELNFLEKAALWGIEAQGRGCVNRRIGSQKALLAIRILRNTGLRIGALGSLKIDRKGYFQTKSKGRLIHGKLQVSILKLINELGFDAEKPLLNYKRNTFGMWMIRTARRYTVKNFGAHSIRHKWAVAFYKKNKDIIGLQKALGHKSLSATQAYLASLENHFHE